LKNGRQRVSTDDSSNVAKENIKRPSESGKSQNGGGLKALQEKHSTPLLTARKQLLKKALELKSKSIRGTRLGKRVTRSADGRRQSPEKKGSLSLERRQRAERRQQLLDSKERSVSPSLRHKRQDKSLRLSRTQPSPATLAARKKAKLAIRPKPKVSRLLLRLVMSQYGKHARYFKTFNSTK